MAYKPFKMKGSPMKRNFGIGDSESPDAETPLNINLGTALSGMGAKIASNVKSAGGWGQVGLKALSAGMGTLKGGYDAYNPKEGSVDLMALFKENPDIMKELLAGNIAEENENEEENE